MDDWPDDAMVPSFAPRMRCKRLRQAWRDGCASWIERADRLPGDIQAIMLSHRTP
jgi:hypothetical protein